MPGFLEKFRSVFMPPATAAQPMRAQGVPGYVVMGGVVSNPETNWELNGSQRWRKASELLTGISIVAASVRYSLNLIARPAWKVDPPNDTAEAKAVAELIDEMLNDTDASLTRIVRRTAMYRYHGFGINEWIAKKRDDGKIGIASIKPRPQHTIERWDLDDGGDVRGVWQRDPQTSKELYLPRPKLIYLVDDQLTDRPDGMGWFRHLVEPADRLKRYLKLEGVGFQRDLVGIPLGRAPLHKINDLVTSGELTREQADSMINGVKDFCRLETKTDTTGLVLDSQTYVAQSDTGEQISQVYEWGMELLTGEASSVDALAAAVKRLEFEMALIMGTGSMLTGREGEGSRALAEDQSRNLYLTINSTLDDMVEAWDRDVITPICAMNGIPDELKPRLTHEDAAFKDVEQMARVLRDMATAGAVLAPDDEAINDLRALLGLPDAKEMTPEELALARGQPPKEEPDEDDLGDDDGGDGGPGGKKPKPKPTDKAEKASRSPGERGHEENPLRLGGWDESKHPRDPSGRWRDVAEDESFPNPLNDAERLFADPQNHKIGGVTMQDTKEGWHLSELRSITRGGGRQAMQEIVDLADVHGKAISLFAVPLDSPAGLKMSKTKLRKWYAEFGFKRTRGDYMVREARLGKRFNPFAKYDPDQPRDPAGLPTGGRWTGGQWSKLPDRIEINGKMRPTTNSLGGQIAKTEEGVQRFYDWFGDSEATDQQGRPQVFYHGTLHKQVMIDEFDPSNAGYDSSHTINAIGTWWTDDPRVAGVFAGYHGRDVDPTFPGGTIYPAYLKVESPQPILDSGHINRLWVEHAGGDERGRNGSPAKFHAWMEASGRDSLWAKANDVDPGIGDNRDADYVVTISPNQIKSVTNIGSFDPNTADIGKAFNPNQPRDPSGTPTGGRWKSATGNAAERMLRQWSDMKRQLMGDKGGRFDDWLLENGEPQGPRVTVDGVKMGPKKQCYSNSMDALLRGAVDKSEWFYTEGQVLPADIPILIDHAWLSNSKGEVLDLTLREGNHSYFGVPFEPDFAIQQTMDQGYYGLFSDGVRYQPVTSEPVGDKRAWEKTGKLFDPNQPRDPAGSATGGQWTRATATVDVDGIERPTTDSTGRQLASDENGVRNFWEWYGDSVLVDEAGRPIRAYHGTSSEFEAFGRIEGGNAYGEGYYFTTDPDQASNYAVGENVNRIAPDGNAGPNVVPAYLKIENPLRVREQLTRAQVGALERADNAISPGRWKRGELWRTFDHAYKPVGDNVLSQLGSPGTDVVRRAGFDGLDTPYGFVVFEPSQIKSANNRGTFDPDDDDIWKSYDPNQPRHPGGSDQGGEWSGGGTGGGKIKHPKSFAELKADPRVEGIDDYRPDGMFIDLAPGWVYSEQRGFGVETVAEALRIMRDVTPETEEARIFRETGKRYDPNQPRDPAGTETGGQWTSTGGTVEPLTKEAKAVLIAPNVDKSLQQLREEAMENQRQLHEIGQRIEDKLNIEFDPPPPGYEVKTEESILRKVRDEGYDSPGSLTDLSRASFVIDSPAEAETVLTELSKEATVYDKGWKRLDEYGYLDRKAYVQWPNGGVSEVQITPRGVYQIKMGIGHRLYEVARKPTTPWIIARSAARKSRRMYNKVVRMTGFVEVTVSGGRP